MNRYDRNAPANRIAKMLQRGARLARYVADDGLWQALNTAGARVGWNSRADVPHSVRMYMLDKRDALLGTGSYSAFDRPAIWR